MTSLFALKYKKTRFPSIWLLISETDTDLSSFQFACTVRHNRIWWLTTAKNNHCPRCHCPDRRLSATLYCSELHTNGPKQRTLGAHEATLAFFFLLLWVEPLCSSVTRCDFMCPCNKGLPTHGHFHVGRAINSPLTGRNNAPSLKRQCLFTVNSRSDAMVTAEYTKPWAEVTHTCDLDLCRSSLTHTSFQELEIPPRGQSANYTWHQREGAWTPVGKMQINVLYSTILGSNSLN